MAISLQEQTIVETDSQLIVRYRPWTVWILAAWFGLGGLILILVFQFSSWPIMLLSGGSLLILVLTKAESWTFDRPHGQLLMQTWNVLGRRTSTIPLDQIREVRAEAVSSGRRAAASQRLSLVLASDSYLYLSGSYQRDDPTLQDHVRRIRTFLQQS
ncbi:MAG: hypothetical protein HC837_16925 [Chloroflexaceae bacterium]|nr:hypothetical protein [Chloroflexaceae bacterium]